MMRTLVVSTNVLDPVSTKLRGLVRTLVDSQGPVATTFDKAHDVLSEVQPELLVVVIPHAADDGLEMVRTLRRGMPGYLMAVGEASNPKLILRALQSGADHYVDQSDLEGELEAAVNRLRIKQEAVSPTGRLLTVLGASGGVGASTLAVNVATVLAKAHGKSCVLDLKPGRGDLAALLDLKPQFDLADLCLNVARLDRAMFEKMLVTHASGVHLLGAPQMFGDTRVVTAPGGRPGAGAGPQDLSATWSSTWKTASTRSRCWRSARPPRSSWSPGSTSPRCGTPAASSSMSRELDVARNHVRVVVNRYGQPNELPVAEAEEALGQKLAHFVPDDPKTVNAANNTGVPAVLKEPAAKVSQSIAQLARRRSLKRRTDVGDAPAWRPAAR